MSVRFEQGRGMRWLRRSLQALLAAVAVFVAYCLAGQSPPAPTDEAASVARSLPCGRPPVLQARQVAATRDFAVPVLVYHHIARLKESQRNSGQARELTVSPEAFEEQLRYLVDNGYSFVTTSEVEGAVRNGGALPVKAVAITIDDGYDDAFFNAYPLLEKYGARATGFLVTGKLNTPGHLTTEQLRMMRELFTPASHTVRHMDLTTLSHDQLRLELAGSKAALERQVEVSVASLAYPAGRCNADVEACLAETGYLAAWTNRGGRVRPSSRPYQLPRVRVSGRADINGFRYALNAR